MAKTFFKGTLLLILIFAMFSLAMTAAAAPTSADALTCMGGIAGSVVDGSVGVFSGVSPMRAVSSDYANLKLYPGGIPFGVKFMTEGVSVTELTNVKTEGGSICPASNCGIAKNDIILEVNGEKLADAATLMEYIEQSGGKPIKLLIRRGDKEFEVTLTPAYCTEEAKYKSGMFVRDSGAGIGTVTYIVPETLDFGGLGHGICDAESGKLVQINRGSVVGVTINGVVKGLSGSPGEVRGYFSSGKTGSLLSNTQCGVFGAFATLPSNLTMEPISVGTKSTLKCGKAYILSTLDGTTPKQYEIEISDIKLNSASNKCFTVKVTDAALLEKTGGIIQGMSGSPIIQNGKLVGAVTHVLINDPTTGYGIFIENMLANS